MAQKYGKYTWKCPRCDKEFEHDTPQGSAMARANHKRVCGGYTPKDCL